MKLLEISKKNVILGHTPCDESQKELVFNLMKAQVVRSRVMMTAVFIRGEQTNGGTITDEMIEQLDQFLIKNIRQTDVFLSTGELERCLLLSHTGTAEAEAFLKRILKSFEKEFKLFSSIEFTASLAEINNREATFDDVITEARDKLLSTKGKNQIEIIESFQEREKEIIKVSIVESESIVSNALYESLKRLSFPYFNLEIMQFKDGYECLESDFIRSGHSHIVILEDILPRMNGLKVVHSLRNMPNQRKFTIFMMTKRQSEIDMLYAYEAGVDQYLIKPFNIRLFEAQIQRTFERFWS